MACAISVLLVDDHALLRKSLHRMLDDDPELTVIGEANNGAEAVELARELAPQVVVMDLAIPSWTVFRLPDTSCGWRRQRRL
jgi:DNA-binding NarL/FixJ family response regulator